MKDRPDWVIPYVQDFDKRDLATSPMKHCCHVKEHRKKLPDIDVEWNSDEAMNGSELNEFQ